MHPYVHSSTIHNSQNMQQPMPTLDVINFLSFCQSAC